MFKLVLTAIALLMVPLCFEPAGAVPLDARGFSASSNVTPVRMAVRGPHGGVAVRGPHGVAVRGPHGGVAVRGAHHVGGRYYGGVWTVRGPHGGVAVRGPHGVAVRGPHGGVAVRGAHHVGGRYYGGVWYGHARRWYGGRWWPYGVGSCWRSSPIGYVWVCG